MNTTSPILLVGVGGAGCAMARGVNRAFGGDMRYVLADTDARTGEPEGPFVLLGGERLAGHGSGGDVVAARMAAEDSVASLDEHLEGVRLAVLVAGLGGGTGGGASFEILKRLAERGIPSIVFATTPFTFEGENRQRNARGILSMIEDSANASFVIPLDKLVADTDNADEAMRRAVDALASAITLFWRLVEKPGYIQMDVERLRHLLSQAGRGRFATATVQGPTRDADAVAQLARSPLLTAGSAPVRAILCGVLAGEDLRLSEIGRVASGIRAAFGEQCTFALGTVNDEQTFTGRLSVVALLFESDAAGADTPAPDGRKGGRKPKPHDPLATGPVGRGRFNNAEPTIWHGEDLDVPTYVRKGVTPEI